MRRRARLTEERINRIVNNSVKKALKEAYDDTYMPTFKDTKMYKDAESYSQQMKAAINDIGSQLAPFLGKVEELNLKYRRWIQDNLDNPHQNKFGYNFAGRFAAAFNEVYEGLQNIDFIYNH